MKKLLMVLAVSAASFAAQAECNGYVMLAACAPGELPGENYNIDGGRISLIYGDCQRLNGLDLSISGSVRERFNGLQIGVLFSINHADAAGLGIGCVNYTAGAFYGCQAGLWNHAGDGYGAQFGIVNTAGSFAGFQCGLFNWADSLAGCQLGLSNCAYGRNSAPWIPFVNIGW